MTSLSNKNVLVTGAAGFIGSHVVERLVEEGAHVRAFIRYTSQSHLGWLSDLRPKTLSEIEIVRGDLRDASAVLDATRGIQIVIHLGALIGIPYSYVHPRETAETNVLGTLNVLMAIRESSGVERLIHTSTSEVYGTAQYVPIDEKHPLQAQSPYSASKIGADKLVESFHTAYGLPVTTLRLFNTYGPRQSARAVIPTIVTQALKGSDLSLGSTTPIRDLTYVTDTAEAFLQASVASGLEGKTIHLGTGVGSTIGEVVKLTGKILKKSLTTRVDPARVRPPQSEVERLISDNRLAKQLLHWSPKTALEDGLDKTVAWIRSHLDHYKSGQYEI
jgi:NAD dependent epimerase/dehydratase